MSWAELWILAERWETTLISTHNSKFVWSQVMPNLAGTASAAVSTWVFVARSAQCCLDHELDLQMFFKCVAVRGFGRHHLQRNPQQQHWSCTCRERAVREMQRLSCSGRAGTVEQSLIQSFFSQNSLSHNRAHDRNKHRQRTVLPGSCQILYRVEKRGKNQVLWTEWMREEQRMGAVKL